MLQWAHWHAPLSHSVVCRHLPKEPPLSHWLTYSLRAVFAPLCLLKAVVVEHSDESLDDRQRGLDVDDSCHGVEDLDEEGSDGVLDLLSAGLEKEGSTFLWKSEVQSTDSDRTVRNLTKRAHFHILYWFTESDYHIRAQFPVQKVEPVY